MSKNPDIKWNALDELEKSSVQGVFEALSSMDAVLAGGAKEKSIGFRSLYDFATSMKEKMPHALAKALLQEPALRRDLDKLLERVSLYQFPKVAAASSGEATGREGDGFSVKLHPSKAESSQIYILVTLANPEAEPPTAIFYKTRDGEYGTAALSSFADGQSQLLLDVESELVRALKDVDAEVFLR